MKESSSSSVSSLIWVVYTFQENCLDHFLMECHSKLWKSTSRLIPLKAFLLSCGSKLMAPISHPLHLFFSDSIFNSEWLENYKGITSSFDQCFHRISHAYVHLELLINQQASFSPQATKSSKPSFLNPNLQLLFIHPSFLLGWNNDPMLTVDFQNIFPLEDDHCLQLCAITTACQHDTMTWFLWLLDFYWPVTSMSLSFVHNCL